MSFAYPFVLVSWWLRCCFWAGSGSGRQDASRCRSTMGGRATGRIWAGILKLAESLPALILGLVIVLLAGPQQLSAPKTRRVLDEYRVLR